MATKTLSKRGRPLKVHRTSWGDQIPGLTRLKDGRWRMSGVDQVTFTEPDERLAVARFLQMKAERDRPKFVHAEALPARKTRNGIAETMLALAPPTTPGPAEILITVSLPDGGPDFASDVTVSKAISTEPEFWAVVRRELLDRPQYAAARTGIEWIAYGPELKRPAPSAKLSALIDAYTAKPKLSPNELSRSKLFWKQFVRAVGVERIGEVGHEQVIAYERVILGAGLAAKSIHHRFSKVRTVVAYGLKRGIDIAGCRQALDALAMLEVKDAHPIDPRPIGVADFWAIHGKALEAEDHVFAAMMLTAANAAMYGGEVASMKWSEVDLKAGTYVGRRPKTKISRVAVLWPEVVEALGKIERRECVDYIFNTSRRSFTSNAVVKLWSRYREQAELGDKVFFGQIRDAAYSIACQHASLDQAKVLAGHAFGGASDFYVRRNPQFVAKACDAIREAFYSQGDAAAARGEPDRRKTASRPQARQLTGERKCNQKMREQSHNCSPRPQAPPQTHLRPSRRRNRPPRAKSPPRVAGVRRSSASRSAARRARSRSSGRSLEGPTFSGECAGSSVLEPWPSSDPRSSQRDPDQISRLTTTERTPTLDPDGNQQRSPGKVPGERQDGPFEAMSRAELVEGSMLRNVVRLKHKEHWLTAAIEDRGVVAAGRLEIARGPVVLSNEAKHTGEATTFLQAKGVDEATLQGMGVSRAECVQCVFAELPL